MVRQINWEQLLAQYLTEHAGAEFRWGELDCVLFAAGAIQAMTGVDPAADVRGRYATRVGSLRKLRARGWTSLEAMMDAHLDRVPPAFAQRGDIVIADRALGVCMGQRAHFVGEEGGTAGLVARPLADWAVAWRVPFDG